MKKKARASERDAAQIGPRPLKDPKSVAFAWQTLALLKTFYQSKAISEKRWCGIIAEAERHEIYTRIPPGKPYGSLDAMLQAEIGETESTARTKIAQRMAADPEVKELAEANTTGRNNPTVYNINGRPAGTSAEYLVRRLKRDRPDLAEALARGKYRSARAAAIEAGIVKVPLPLERMKKEFGKLDARQREQFRVWVNEQ